MGPQQYIHHVMVKFIVWAVVEKIKTDRQSVLSTECTECTFHHCVYYICLLLTCMVTLPHLLPADELFWHFFKTIAYINIILLIVFLWGQYSLLLLLPVFQPLLTCFSIYYWSVHFYPQYTRKNWSTAPAGIQAWIFHLLCKMWFYSAN